MAAGTKRKYIMISGKGGVGKTSLAASLAVKFAAAGHTTLVVSTDPAHSLSDSLDQVLASCVHKSKYLCHSAPCLWVKPGPLTDRMLFSHGQYRHPQFLVMNFPADTQQHITHLLASIPGLAATGQSSCALCSGQMCSAHRLCAWRMGIPI